VKFGHAVDAIYEWDLGDPTGAHNTLSGFNAAHVYRNAGAYTITLKVTNAGGKTSVTTTTVNITADNSQTIYVSSAGNDSISGLSSDQAVRSVGRANQLLQQLGDDTKVLFRRGDTFDVVGDYGLEIKGRNVTVGAYGTGALPTLRTASQGQYQTIKTGRYSEDVTIRDLRFDSIYGADTHFTGATRAVQPMGKNLAVTNCVFQNVNDGVNAEMGVTGLLVQDNTVPTTTSLRGYFVWGAGSDLVIVGNYAPNSTRQHIVRLGGVERILVAENDFANISQAKAGDTPDIAKGSIILAKGAWAVAQGNKMAGGGLGVGPLGGPDGVSDAGARATNVVVRGNFVDQTIMSVGPGSEHVRFINNVIHRDGDSGIVLTPTDTYSSAYAGRAIIDLVISHNTGINNSTIGRFIDVKNATNYDHQITVQHNLYVAPHLTTGSNRTGIIAVNDNDLSTFKDISFNVWNTPNTGSYAQGGYFYVLNYWSDPKGYLTPQEWDAHSQVHDDVYQDVILPSDTFSATVNGVTGGASLKLAA
ncbi:MAG: PKD domain-containing protein, partial [Tepidisphaeraceae bacterium]